MNGLDSSPDMEELTTEVIDKWVKDGLVDFCSRTLRADFSDVLVQLQRTDIHIRALEEVFRALMEIHFQDGLDKKYIKTMPNDVFAVLREEEQLDLDVPNDFFINLIGQMREYYNLYLQWKGA